MKANEMARRLEQSLSRLALIREMPDSTLLSRESRMVWARGNSREKAPWKVSSDCQLNDFYKVMCITYTFLVFLLCLMFLLCIVFENTRSVGGKRRNVV